MLKRIKTGCIASLSILMVIFTPIIMAEDLADPSESFLWEIRQEGERIASLLGTVHIGPKEMVLSPAVETQLVMSDRLITENQMIFASMAEEAAMAAPVTALMIQPVLMPLSERFDESNTKVLQDFLLNRGIPTLNHGVVTNKGILIFLLLDIGEEYSPEFGMETRLKDAANRLNMPNQGLESVEESLKPFMEMTDAQAVALIEVIIQAREKAQVYQQALIRNYMANDVKAFLATVEEMEEVIPYPEIDPEYWQAFDYAMLEARNLVWASRIPEMLAQLDDNETPFIAVGALHLFGEEGLVMLLQKAGFEMIPIDGEKRVEIKLGIEQPVKKRVGQ